MNRRDNVFACIDKEGVGLEIGPAHNPIAPKKEGYKVHIIDHMSRDQLLEKYKDHGVNLDNIEEVDYVWSGESFEDLTGKAKYYDYIIASHVIEHTPDLIGFLQNCDAVLKDSGVISLVVPDKRYCFDHYRPISGLSRVIDSYYSQCKIHSAGTAAEYFMNVVSKNGKISWNPNSDGKYRFVHSVTDATNVIQSVIRDKTYFDVHSWCFTPSSFRLMIHGLFMLNLIPFLEICYSETQDREFYITLARNGKGISESRMKMLEKIEVELSQAKTFRFYIRKFWRKFQR